MILVLCSSLCYSVATKILFNFFAKPDKNYRVPIDRWTKFDLLAAIASLVGYPLILSMTPK